MQHVLVWIGVARGLSEAAGCTNSSFVAMLYTFCSMPDVTTLQEQVPRSSSDYGNFYKQQRLTTMNQLCLH